MPRPSSRLPLPVAPPAASGRTPEQGALLAIGGLALGLALGLAAAALRLESGWHPLLVAFPLLFLVAGWGALSFGLLHLDGPRRQRSLSRGRLGAVGLALILLCGPLPASLLYPARRVARPFSCGECGARGHLSGSQDLWGLWLEREVRLGGQLEPPPGGWRRARPDCAHAPSLPWLASQ